LTDTYTIVYQSNVPDDDVSSVKCDVDLLVVAVAEAVPSGSPVHSTRNRSLY